MNVLALAQRQTRLEQLAFWRNPDYAFFTFALPLVLLALLGSINADDGVDDRPIKAITLVVPGVLAFAVVIAAFGNLATRLAVLRSEGVLKRIRTTPLPPALYIFGHLASTVITAALSSIATIALGHVLFDVSPLADRWAPLFFGIFFGVTCFAALGMAISTVIPHADAAGPITNAAYLPLAIVSGLFDPTIMLPSWLDAAVALLPVRALYEMLAAGYDPTANEPLWGNVIVLACWAVFGVAASLRYFRWAER